MGGLSIMNNTEIRCIKCFNIYTIKIKPEFPKCKLLKTCKCSQITTDFFNFFTEYKKNKNITISCLKCKKSNPKDPFYCEDCNQLICSNCLKNTHKEEEFKNHKYISIEKYDFFCIIHQTEKFCAYCKTCKLNICEKCIKENLHENHKISIFKKIYDEKKMKEYYKKAIKGAEDKINYNKIICNLVSKKINKNDAKKLKSLLEINESENKYILEILNIFNEMYDANKNNKSFTLISNMIDNMDFNLEKIKFEKNSTKENDVLALVDYFQTDFILKVKVKKEDNKNNEAQNAKEKEKDKKESNEINKEEEKIPEEKKEEEKKEEENKEEKKEEEKKEEEKKEEEKNEEEEKVEDDGHVKTMKEIKELLNNKISSQGGFRRSTQTSVQSNQNKDIINEPKGNPENVITIIQSQTINKKAKKKPRKIKFDS
jgi:hypothetical protein